MAIPVTSVICVGRCDTYVLFAFHCEGVCQVNSPLLLEGRSSKRMPPLPHMSRIFLCKTYSREHDKGGMHCLTQWASTREELTLEVPRCHQVNIALFPSPQLPSLAPIVFILAVGLNFLYSKLAPSSHGGIKKTWPKSYIFSV